MKVAVVILNWNGQKLLSEFLPNIIDCSKDDAEIYVIDNASSDNSVSFITSNFPEVKVVINKINGGFAKGYNDGLKQIKAPIFALINSDVEVTKNWLEPVIKQFEKEKNVAIIQPKILSYKDKNLFEYAGAAGGFVDFFGYPYCRGRIFMNLEEDTSQYNDIKNIFWASGACLFIRSSVFNQLNGFDEDYFAHQEEIDLCWRAQNEDHIIQYVGESTVYHIGAATLREENPTKTFLNFRNSLYTITKNVPKRFLPIVIFTRLILDGVAGIKFLFELRPIHTWALIKAHGSFYYHLVKMLRKRKFSQHKRHHYYDTFSVVWAHFILRKITFKKLH